MHSLRDAKFGSNQVEIGTAQKLIYGAGLYGAIGLVVGIAFLILGVAKHDPMAKGLSLATRLILMPGMIMLWPIMIDIWLFGPRDKRAEGSGCAEADL